MSERSREVRNSSSKISGGVKDLTLDLQVLSNATVKSHWNYGYFQM